MAASETSRLIEPQEPIRYLELRPGATNETESGSVAKTQELVNPGTRIAIFGAVWTGVFLGAFDSTLVATLVSSISSSFGQSNQLSWLATAYLLSISATGALYGKLADLIGRRASLLVALSLFTFGTIGCAVASNMSQLIFARFLAGCGGGGIMTTSSIIATDLVELEQRALVQGFANTCYAAGAALGGPLGGWLTDSYGWRFAFWVQIPPLVIAMVAVGTLVNYKIEGQVTSRAELISRIDYQGSLVLMLTVGCLLLSLSFKTNLEYSWSDPIVYLTFIGFMTGVILFIWIENRAAEPVLPVGLLKLRTPACTNGVNFFTSMVVFSVLYMYPLWFETVKLTSATEAGLHLIPNSLALSLGSLAVGYWIRRSVRYRPATIASSICVLLGCILMVSKLDNPIHEWLDIVPVGFGFSASITVLLVAFIASVPGKDMAVCTGASYLFRYTGQVLGVATTGAILQATLTMELKARITGPDAYEIIQKIRHQSSMVKQLPEGFIREAAVESYKAGLRSVFGFNVVLALVALMISLGVQEFSLIK